jgi:HTH-type transcriptional regulator / antitoxin HigA
MEIRPIRTQTDYQETLREIEQLFDAAKNTPEYDQLNFLDKFIKIAIL